MRILVLCPHTDDGEWSAGGTIARFIEEGHDVYYIAFSSADISLPREYKKGHLKTECLNAVKVLGIDKKKVKFFDYKTRRFPENRQEILEDIYKLNSSYNPDIVLTPSSFDTHQDHQTISEETKRVFKTSATIWGYLNPMNTLSFSYDIFVEISKEQLNKKIRAVLEYHSQRKIRQYFSKDAVLSLAITNGFKFGCKYAECFELVRGIKRLDHKL